MSAGDLHRFRIGKPQLTVTVEEFHGPCWKWYFGGTGKIEYSWDGNGAILVRYWRDTEQDFGHWERWGEAPTLLHAMCSTAEASAPASVDPPPEKE